MKPPTTTYFFLGANSESGFYSLYDQFCSAPTDMLHIIKGGPGTGKSTFMRKIGTAAEAHGLDVEYILCSGDPASLDGIYIPALQMGWADGTAPHILEPHHFGISALYEDLGRFCRHQLLMEQHDQITAFTKAYRQSYQTAYEYLRAAASIRISSVKQIPSDIEAKIQKRAHAKIKRELKHTNHSSKPIKRFLQAISHTGLTVVDQTINTLCSRLCILASDHGLEQFFFREVEKELIANNCYYILCPDPLLPHWINGILLPEEELCFLSSNTSVHFQGVMRTIHLDSYLPKEKKSERTMRKNLYEQSLSAAITHLHNAKLLHDELELCYRPALDTQALNDYTQSVIDGLF